jgi:hypothetical protein
MEDINKFLPPNYIIVIGVGGWLGGGVGHIQFWKLFTLTSLIINSQQYNSKVKNSL